MLRNLLGRGVPSGTSPPKDEPYPAPRVRDRRATGLYAERVIGGPACRAPAHQGRRGLALRWSHRRREAGKSNPTSGPARAPRIGAKATIHQKGRWSCTVGVTSVTYQLFLFLCPQPPTGAEGTWESQGCLEKAPESDVIANPGSAETRYVPATGKPGITGTGYFVACNMWYFEANGLTSPSFSAISQAVYLSV